MEQRIPEVPTDWQPDTDQKTENKGNKSLILRWGMR